MNSICVSSHGKDQTLINFNGVVILLDCTLEALELAIWEARQQRDQLPTDPDEGFAKPMGPWGKEEV